MAPSRKRRMGKGWIERKGLPLAARPSALIQQPEQR